MHSVYRLTECVPRLLCVAAFALPAAARADIITCSFTEPFVTTVYSTTENTLAIAYNVSGRHLTLDHVSFQILKPGVFELWNDKHEVVQRLELSYTGSDGMSDRVYPYEVHWVQAIPEKLDGGCTSNHLK